MSSGGIKFDVIPLDKVPFRVPVARPITNPRGSQWDEVLKILERRRGKYVYEDHGA